MPNPDIKIPEMHYVTFQTRDDSNCPLAFMTPYGTDSAAKKRMNTADNWARGYSHGSTNFQSKKIKNELMSGFKISKNIQRFSTSNVVWRIEDPRGFELEISSENLSEIIQICTIENGEILTPCIWGRLKSINILIPETSDNYKAAIKNTKRLQKNVKITDVKIGNDVLLQSGEYATYMGSFYHVYTTYGKRMTDELEESKIEISKKKRHFFYIDEFNGMKSYFKAIVSPKISEIINCNTIIDISVSEEKINNMLLNLDANIVDGRNDNEYRLNGVIANKPSKMTIQLEPNNDIVSYAKNKEEKSNKTDKWWGEQKFIALHNEKYYEINGYQFLHSNLSQTVSGPTINEDKLINDLIIYRKYSIQSVMWPSRNVPRSVSKVEKIQISDAIWFIPFIKIENEKTKNVFAMEIH